SGGMASLGLSPERAEELIAGEEDLHLAVVNGPESVVVSGTPASVRRAVEYCVDHGVHGALIHVDYASHSSHVERVHDDLLELLDGVEPRPSSVPFLSTLTGGLLEGTDTSMDA